MGWSITLSAGTLILALSSLTRRTLYVGITWAGLWIISAAVGGILTAIHGESVHRQLWAAEQNRWLDEHPPPAGVRMLKIGSWQSPAMRQNPKTGRRQLDGLRPEQEQEGERWYQAWNKAQWQAWEKAWVDQYAATRGDWRPMCSYVANLERIADLLLDTANAWITLGKATEPPRGPLNRPLRAMFGSSARPPGYERRFADRMVLQHPWWWSAAVLASLLGVSTWILAHRVKSLDRLK